MLAVVTGGSKGIGEAICRQLANDGYTVVVNYNSSGLQAERIANEIGGYSYHADISNLEEVKSMIDYTIQNFGNIDLLVNNAGISVVGLFHEISQADVKKILDINLNGVFNCTSEVVKHMISKKSGNIINISSMWGEVGGSCEVHYSATKSAIIGFTKALAKEVGLSGIRVNCVSPGVIDTSMNKHLTEDDINSLKEEIPLYRLGTPQDVANVVSFLASERASYITAQDIAVNGGIC
ncbi:MAG: 3-oxoacyl-ACP reductase FabG [Ruminococcus sp.]|nr:3-oxoacyl-ACP reductase FabG [Ruminococcus sp.]